MAVNNKLMIGSLTGAAAVAAAFFMPFESLHHIAYNDPPGIHTICYGHAHGVNINQYATDRECAVYLGEDVTSAENAVNSLVKVHLSDKTKAALISFTFNTDIGTFKKSTMLKKLNSGDIRGACDQLPRFVYSGGKILNGLIRRRLSEQKLCIEGL